MAGRGNTGVTLRALLLPLLLGCSAQAAKDDSDEAPRRIPEVTGPVFREVRSIPYPGGALYLTRGIAGAFMGGKVRNLGEQQSLFQWQGEVSYYYTSFFSGGAGFKITAGEPSDTAQKIQNRYFLHARFHKSFDDFAFFIGPDLALDNLNVLKGSPTDSVLQKPFRNTNAGVGLEAGGGWKFSRWVGLTFGGQTEYSLVGEQGSILGNALDIHLLPGIAVDLLSFTDTLRELVPAFYFSLEYQAGYLLFERGQKRHDHAVIGGLSVAF